MAAGDEAGSPISGSYTLKYPKHLFKEIFHFEGSQLHLHNLQNIPARRHCFHFTGAATEAKKKKGNCA